jgi:hypothetical protein
MKLKLKGRRFYTTEDIQVESQRVLDTLTVKDFQEAFQKWRSPEYFGIDPRKAQNERMRELSV